MKTLSKILPIVTAILGILVAIAPYTFAQVCSMPSMHCRAVTAPTVLVFGIVIFVLSVIQTFAAWKKN